MAPRRDQLRFYVDESALGLGKALTFARSDVVHVGHPLVPTCEYGSYDTVWMPEVAKMNLVVIARDRRIRKRPQELLAFHDVGLRAFWIRGKKDLTTWEWLVRLVKHWKRIETIVESQGPGPWGYVVTDGGVNSVPLRPPPTS